MNGQWIKVTAVDIFSVTYINNHLKNHWFRFLCASTFRIYVSLVQQTLALLMHVFLLTFHKKIGFIFSTRTSTWLGQFVSNST